MALAPYMPLALRAAARPPLPPPMTRKSHSFGTGAMVEAEEENWRVRDVIRLVAVRAGVEKVSREAAKGDSLSVIVRRPREV